MRVTWNNAICRLKFDFGFGILMQNSTRFWTLEKTQKYTWCIPPDPRLTWWMQETQTMESLPRPQANMDIQKVPNGSLRFAARLQSLTDPVKSLSKGDSTTQAKGLSNEIPELKSKRNRQFNVYLFNASKRNHSVHTRNDVDLMTLTSNYLILVEFMQSKPLFSELLQSKNMEFWVTFEFASLAASRW